MKRVLVVIPAYNEAESIEKFLGSVMDYIEEGFEILIIDDGSKDNTVEIVKRFGHNVKIISQPYNMGYGSALQLGYKYASVHKFDYVIQMDADGQHDACNIKIMKDIIERSDAPNILIGSRFLKGSSGFHISIMKKLAISVFRAIILLTSGQRVTDPTSGLQCLDRKAFDFYAGYTNFDYQYPDANMIIQMGIKGYIIGEFPAVMHPRESGVSMHSGMWKPFVYIVIMTLSILNVYIREKGHRKK